MKKLETVRNVLFMVGVIAFSSAFVKNPAITLRVEMSFVIMSAGFLVEIVRFLIIWTRPKP